MTHKAFHILRGFHILLFISTALGKLLDVHGFAAVIATYQLSIPERLLFPLALVVCLVELGVGGILIRNRNPVKTSLICLTINALYLTLALISLARGLELKNCGCFGVFLARPLTWQTPVEDLVLVGVSFAFYRLAKNFKASPKC